MLIMINGLSFLERHHIFSLFGGWLGFVLDEQTMGNILLIEPVYSISALQMSQHTLGITLNSVMVVGNMVFIYLGFSD